MTPLHSATAALVILIVAAASAQSASSCSTTLTPTNSIKPSLASGYQAALVATGLTKPRSIQFDSAGNLLVVQAGSGVESLQLQDNGGTCVSVKSKKSLVSSKGLNHGLALSADSKILYASEPEAAYSWDYDPASSTVGKTNKTLVKGMNTQDHTTRTLLLSQKAVGMLLISRGSTSNLDLKANSLDSGHSQIRAFNLSNTTSVPYDFTTNGMRLGWGIRNAVGVAEHRTGLIYSVENSADEITRDGVNIHENNPGERLLEHGALINNTFAAQGSNYGYPNCFAAWMPAEIPNNANLTVGSQFAIGTPNATINDTFCARTTPPRLTFQAHMAPLDIKFNNSGTEAWVTFHGSWDRSMPSGYKLSVIQFDNGGSPVAPPNANNSYKDVFANMDNSKCPDHCFRPTGLTVDPQGRIFMSSDATGEIYLIMKDFPTNGTAGGSPAAGNSPGGKTSSATERWASRSVLVVLTILFCVHFSL